MPLRDPVFNPPFNIVRASHVELGVADLAQLARLLCRLPRLHRQPTRTRTRSICAASRSATITRSCCASRTTSRRSRSASRSAARRTSTRPPTWLERAQAAGVVAERAVSGPHAAHRRSGRHAARSLFQDGSRAIDAAEIRGLQGRAHPAHRPHQLLHAGRAGLLRLLHRARLPPHRDDRDRRRRSEALGRVDAAQGQHARPRLHQRRAARACITSACGMRTRSTSCTPAT